MARRAILGLLCLVACSDDDSTADAQKDAVVGERSCEVLTVDECKLDARCETIDGSLFYEQLRCADDAERPLGCHDKNTSCPPAIVYARGPDKNTYEFASGCWPSGFERFTPNRLPDSSCSTGGCAEHNADECAQDERCTDIKGRLLDETKQCLADQMFAGCTTRGLGCNQSIVVATDRTGKRWWFSDSCIPNGFTSPTSDGPTGWPLCTAKPPATPRACSELTGDECVHRSDCDAIEARAIDATNKCVRGPKNVGCQPAGTGCTEALSYGRDAQGQAWAFNTGCQPAGFTYFQPTSDEMPDSTWTQGCP